MSKELSVEEALNQLREMYPRCWVFVDMHANYSIGPRGKREQKQDVEIQAETGQEILVSTRAPTLSEAMTQVRQWKESQKDQTK